MIVIFTAFDMHVIGSMFFCFHGINGVTVLSFRWSHPFAFFSPFQAPSNPSLPFGIFCQKRGAELLELMETEKCRGRAT